MNTRKTIWFVNKYATPPGSNAGLRALSLSREFILRGHFAIVINSRANHYFPEEVQKGEKAFGRFTYAENWGVPTFTHQTFSYKRTASTRRVLSWLDFELGLLLLRVGRLPGPTHIIVSSPSLLTILNGYLLSRRLKARLVFEIRDIWPLSMTARSRFTDNNPLVGFLLWVEKFGYRKADVIVGQMPNLVEHVDKTVGPGKIVRSIGLGIDPDLEVHLNEHVECVKSNVFRIVYTGSIGRSNALETLLDVARSLHGDPTVAFEFFGKGDFLEGFREQYADFPMVMFHGDVPRKKLLIELGNADVSFLSVDQSEIWRFGQSLHKIVDYMAVGRPILAAYGGHASMINEAGCGFFVPPADFQALKAKILELKAMSPAELDAIGQRGRKWIMQNRTYKKLAEEYLRVLELADQR